MAEQGAVRWSYVMAVMLLVLRSNCGSGGQNCYGWWGGVLAGGAMPRYCLPYKGAQYWVRKKKVKLPTDHEIISRYTHRQLDVVLKETDSKIKKLTGWYLLNLTLAKKWFGIAQENPHRAHAA